MKKCSAGSMAEESTAQVEVGLCAGERVRPGVWAELRETLHTCPARAEGEGRAFSNGLLVMDRACPRCEHKAVGQSD